MQLDEYLKQERGRAAALAAHLKVAPVNVVKWRRGGPVSVIACVAIERWSNGAVARWDLRPDDWFDIWPELSGIEGAPPLPAADTEARHAA